jgi:hypothetical protein
MDLTVVVQLQAALFTVCHEGYPHYELKRFSSLVALEMEVICSSETSVLTTATWY